jgi:hypothetical protein
MILFNLFADPGIPALLHIWELNIVNKLHSCRLQWLEQGTDAATARFTFLECPSEELTFPQ